ncbi:MAG: hypothetical protein Q4G71_00475 [Pseudomonadota bacterium]|nr:hypothetical protein [Pseudomonadota bacterium]
MSDRILQAIELGGGHTRSIALDRDLNDGSAVKKYLLTPAATSALKQVGQGLIDNQAQRAWKIMGPYGSGKSALGVMLAQLLSGRKAHPAASLAITKSAPQLLPLFKTANRFPLAIVGARVSIGAALAHAIGEALGRLGKGKAASALKKQLDLDALTYKGMPVNAVAGTLAADFAQATVSEGFDGVLLLIDEVGKFVEHAALHPDVGDLIALQQIAEHACQPEDAKLAVVAMLHQHFASYAAGVGRSLGDEWQKVASRFDEIAFDEPVERYAHFVAHAIGAKPAIHSNPEVMREAQALYASAKKLGVLRALTAADHLLFDHAQVLYPLHPFSVAALAVVAKRYGQSERSFHAFLRGNEPLGLRDFADRHNVDPAVWFRLPEVFDYLASGHGLRFRDLGAERRWAFALAAMERETFDKQALRVLKSIAVLELVSAGLGGAVTAETIAFALGNATRASVAKLCDGLVEQGLLVRRRAKAEYAFAVSEAVNIEAVYEKAARGGEDELVITGVSHALSQRLIVANKHYDRSGTVRTVGVLVGSPAHWPKPPAFKSDEARPDGWIRLVLVMAGSDDEALALQRLKQEADPFSVCGRLSLTPESRAALAEYSIWLAVQREVTSKRLDPWTSQYVAGRLHDVSEQVSQLVLCQLMPVPGNPGPEYWHNGRLIANSRHMNASQLASWLFDSVYSETPRIVNELINKDKPPSAIVLARQRMFEFILGADPAGQLCGASEFPPERLIHNTLLRQTGIWREDNGRWSLAEPTTDAAIDISKVWAAISQALRASEAPTFAGVLAALAAPPLGVRAGPAGIWIVLYLMIHRSQCAIFERGTLILELTNEHLQRMYKNPQTFELRELANGTDSRKLLHEYQTAFAAIGCAVRGELTYLELARSLYRWYARLPEFSLQTARIGKDASLVRSVLKKAQDPIKLLTSSLPETYAQAHVKVPFGEWLTATLSDLGMAHRRLQEAMSVEISQAFAIAGPLSRVRNQLQAECAGTASDLADIRLKSFILRCTDLSLTDEKWLDSIGSLVVQRPLDAWADETIGKFAQELTESCGRYRRWMRMVTERGLAPRASERFVGLTLTLPGGQESSLFVATSDASTAVARSVMALITEETGGNAQLAASALAQALLELQTPVTSASQEESADGNRKAS